MIGRALSIRRGSGDVRANMTPMVDVVFLLIIFFMLVAQISRQRVVEVELPRIEESVSTEIEGEGRTVVNVVPESRVAQLGGDYRLGALAFDASDAGLDRLTHALREASGADPDTLVLVRAARTEAYERVYPVLRAVGDAGIGRVSLVMLPERGP
jgi:biopolymer transport protein ExbD